MTSAWFGSTRHSSPLSESRPYARHNLNLTAFNLAAPPNPPSPPPPIAPSFPLLSRLSPPFVYAALPLAAALMSVLSCGPPFHTAALTITSITSNYLAVFPLLALSPPFISLLELYAFQMGATAPPAPLPHTPLPPSPPPSLPRLEEGGRGEVFLAILPCPRWETVTADPRHHVAAPGPSSQV